MGLRIGDVALGHRPAIVACGGEADLDALATANGAHLVEVRGDLFADPTPARVLDALGRVRRGGRPVILTVRRADEGGTPMPDARRREILAAAAAHVDAVDLEIASADVLGALRPALAASGCTLILSAHDFAGTPAADRLQSTVDHGRALGADVVKIATRADDHEALCRLLAVTLANRAAGVVTLAMGAYGPLSRVALPAAGSCLTYAAAARPTAPGQIALAELAPMLDRLYEGT
jgi:3-dehydroquinate dehydratase-1